MCEVNTACTCVTYSSTSEVLHNLLTLLKWGKSIYFFWNFRKTIIDPIIVVIYIVDMKQYAWTHMYIHNFLFTHILHKIMLSFIWLENYFYIDIQIIEKPYMSNNLITVFLLQDSTSMIFKKQWSHSTFANSVVEHLNIHVQLVGIYVMNVVWNPGFSVLCVLQNSNRNTTWLFIHVDIITSNKLASFPTYLFCTFPV